MTKIDPRALRNAFGAFMTGVTVVTTHNEDGPLGFTANSFTSVSLDPPLILVCLANSSSNYEAFEKADGFAVNILSEAQKQISNTFARPVEDRFASVGWRPGPYGSPLLAEVSAWFDCSMFNKVEAGDHLILIGKVEAFDSSTRPGLGYARGTYVTAAAEAHALSQHANVMVAALIAREGRVLLLPGEQKQLVLPGKNVDRQGASAALRELIEACGCDAQPGFIYSVYENKSSERQYISFLCQAGSGRSSVGQFMNLSADTLNRVNDPGVRAMLERYASECRMGNFGVYVGNQLSGEVRSLRSGNGS